MTLVLRNDRSNAEGQIDFTVRTLGRAEKLMKKAEDEDIPAVNADTLDI